MYTRTLAHIHTNSPTYTHVQSSYSILYEVVTVHTELQQVYFIYEWLKTISKTANVIFRDMCVWVIEYCLVSECTSNGLQKNIVTYYWQPCVLLIFRYPSLLGGQIIFQAESSTQHSTVLHAQCTLSHHLLVVILDLPRRHPCTCHHRHDDSAYHDDSQYSGELTTTTRALYESYWCLDVHLSHIRVRVAIGVCNHSHGLEKGDTSKPTTRYHKVLSRTRRRNRHRPGKGNNPIVCFKVPYLCELLYVSYKRHAMGKCSGFVAFCCHTGL